MHARLIGSKETKEILLAIGPRRGRSWTTLQIQIRITEIGVCQSAETIFISTINE